MKNLFKGYSGQYVAMVNKKIIASGKTTLEAYQKAKKINSTEMLSFTYVPTKKETITFL
ncbi:hypothetical protein J4437_04285 [Candidatus Woesearchaeota archaeon]|nr:hypothetical protein [Candidatus Woesearchaeota archaeon]